MITAENLIYSKSALSRVLKINPKSIVRFEVWASVVFVIIKGQRPTFVSKKVFKKEFSDFRERNSKSVNIIPHSVSDKLFLAQSEGSTNRHQVEIYESYDGTVKSRCICGDYKKQIKNRFYLKKETGKFDPRCKHQIALETFLGGNLKDYINELKAIDEEAEYLRAKADLFGDWAAY
jgi:hypothetical protein